MNKKKIKTQFKNRANIDSSHSVLYKKNHHKKSHVLQTDQNMTLIHSTNNTWLNISDSDLLNPFFLRNIKLRAIFAR